MVADAGINGIFTRESNGSESLNCRVLPNLSLSLATNWIELWTRARHNGPTDRNYYNFLICSLKTEHKNRIKNVSRPVICSFGFSYRGSCFSTVTLGSCPRRSRNICLTDWYRLMTKNDILEVLACSAQIFGDASQFLQILLQFLLFFAVSTCSSLNFFSCLFYTIVSWNITIGAALS